MSTLVRSRMRAMGLVGLLALLGIAASTAQGAASQAEDPEMGGSSPLCPRQLNRRSTEQVLEAHLAAVRSGNAALIACDYGRKAVFLLQGAGAAIGREQIEATFAGFLSQAGPINSVQVTSQTVYEDTVLLTYTIDSQHILVRDGVDTFIIENGRITLQTAYLGGLSGR
jgi:hypothetical protein